MLLLADPPLLLLLLPLMLKVSSVDADHVEQVTHIDAYYPRSVAGQDGDALLHESDNEAARQQLHHGKDCASQNLPAKALMHIFSHLAVWQNSLGTWGSLVEKETIAEVCHQYHARL